MHNIFKAAKHSFSSAGKAFKKAGNDIVHNRGFSKFNKDMNRGTRKTLIGFEHGFEGLAEGTDYSVNQVRRNFNKDNKRLVKGIKKTTKQLIIAEHQAEKLKNQFIEWNKKTTARSDKWIKEHWKELLPVFIGIALLIGTALAIALTGGAAIELIVLDTEVMETYSLSESIPVTTELTAEDVADIATEAYNTGDTIYSVSTDKSTRNDPSTYL